MKIHKLRTLEDGITLWIITHINVCKCNKTSMNVCKNIRSMEESLPKFEEPIRGEPTIRKMECSRENSRERTR